VVGDGVLAELADAVELERDTFVLGERVAIPGKQLEIGHGLGTF
jgi:hypothetical protein